MERIEGSGASQLVQLIRTIGYNTEITFELATVTSAPPRLKIKVDHMNVELEKDDLIVVQSLAKHTRIVNLKSVGKTEVSSSSPTIGFTLLQDGNAQTHELSFSSVKLASADQTVQGAELEFTDELKKDDRIVVAGINQGQTYIILDRVVRY
ncbi:DUF2577 family protein [Fontibacillus sp. BL9]|uniref:DUF2577 family protein n=1 Tax=Fontibacillus sp. BL9 TaxID=3389971 RepID=UPI00397B65AB